MDWLSWRCARGAAHAFLCTMIGVAGSGCADTAPGEAPGITAPPVIAPDFRAPAADASTVVSAPAADAMASSPVAAPVTTPRDSVDADGIRGALVDLPFLADMGDGKKSLILVDWEIPPGEFYLCGRITVPEDLYFSAQYPENPLGTHHTAVSVIEKPNAPDGVRRCDVSEVGRRNLGGSGVGTGGGKLPQGMAMKAERGSQLILNLHLFNTTEAPLRGRSGGLVETIAASQVTTLVDGVAVGPLKLNIPPGRSVQTGVCTVESDYTVLRVFPHMHEMGRHMKVVAKRALGGEVVLYDGGYDFTHQFTYPVEPALPLAAGDRIEIACSYDNTSGQELHFGESSKDEMCIAGLVRFPAGGKSSCPY